MTGSVEPRRQVHRQVLCRALHNGPSQTPILLQPERIHCVLFELFPQLLSLKNDLGV